MLYFMYIEFKPFHIKGGSQALSNALANKFLSHGGTARFNCGVKKILVDNGVVRGVITEHGDHIQAKYVISNASQVSTYVQLLDGEHVPNNVYTEMRGRTLSPSAFTMFAGLDCEPADVGITETTNFLVTNADISDVNLARMWNLDIQDEVVAFSCYDVADVDFSPPGTCQLNMVTLKYGEPWLRISPTEYFRVKHRCAEAMLRRVEDFFPDIREHMEELEVATPLTHMRYLGHPSGAIYGFEHYTKDSMFFQPGRYSPIQGLYFASGWIGDAGFQPTLHAGVAAAKSILRDLGAE
jgi:prolycopene isomerase